MSRSTRGAVAVAAAAVVAALTLAACSPVDESVASPSPTEANLGTLGAAGCLPPSPSLGQEVQGTGSSGITAYGLMFAGDADSLVADPATIKMVVRMTGSGDLSVRLTAPDGTDRPLDWGPERHGGSTFQRPGEEWGIGFTFDSPGCWQIAFEREERRADFWFDVGE